MRNTTDQESFGKIMDAQIEPWFRKTMDGMDPELRRRLLALLPEDAWREFYSVAFSDGVLCAAGETP